MTTYALYIEAENEEAATAEVASLLGTEPLPWVKEDEASGTGGAEGWSPWFSPSIR